MLKQFSLAYKGRFTSPVTAYIPSVPAHLNLRFKFCVSLVSVLVFVAVAFPLPVQAAVNQTITIQSRLVNLATGQNPTTGTPACVKAGADTCDFQIRIWNHITNSNTTSGTGNLLFTQTFQDVEIGDNNGIFSLSLNSCGSTTSGNSQWGTSVGTCTATDDSDSDSDPGVNFNRTDLYLEIGFAPADTASSLGSFTELFTRLPMTSVTSALYAQDVASFGSLTSSNFLQISPSSQQSTGNTSNTIVQINEDGTGTPNLLDLQVAGTSRLFVNNSGQTGFGTSTLRNAWATLAAPSTSFSQINLVASAAVNPTSPIQGDLWYNGTNLNFYDGTRTVDLLPTNAQGFVKLQPTSVQTAGGTDTLIWLNSTAGTPNLADIQVGSTSRFLVNNAGQLQLSRQGSTGGLLIGGDVNLYRSATTTLKTDDSMEIGTNTSNTLTVLGVTDLYGSAVAGNTIGNGSTTANGSGTNSTTLIVASTTNFDAGNLILINGTTVAYIESVNNPTQMTISPAATWSNGNSVVEYTAATVGGDGTLNQQRFSKAYFTGGVITGGSGSGTQYKNGLLYSPGGQGLIAQTATGVLDLNSQDAINLSTSGGLTITRNAGLGASGTWSTGASGGTARRLDSQVLYDGKLYMWGGCTSGSCITPSIINTLDIYDINSNTWTVGTAGGTARYGHTAVVYNNKMYSWGGYGGVSNLNTMDIYDFATGTWSTGTAGGTARRTHSVVLYNNKMYIWGGVTSTYVNTMDIYDFVTDTWSTGATGGTARSLHPASVFNGKMYSWGGYGASGALNTMDVYDFATNTWSTGVTGGTARYGQTAAVYNGKLYEWGGADASSVFINTMDIYDFATGTWTTGITGGTARQQTPSSIANGRLYIWAGSINSVTVINSLDIYTFGADNSVDSVLRVNVGDQTKLNLDTANVLTISGQALGLRYSTNDLAQYTTQGWSTGTAGGTARTFFQSVVYNGKMYVWGGAGASFTPLYNTMDIYDFATASWTTGAAGGTARWGYGAALYNGKIYYVSGFTDSTRTAPTTVVDIYNIATNSWTTGTSGGTARGGAASGFYNGQIFLWGGNNTAGTNINTLDIYNVITDSWTTGTAGGTARRFAQAAVSGGKVYIWGGWVAAASNVLDIYDMQTNSWIAGTNGGTARYAPGMSVYNDKIYAWSGCVDGSCATTLLNTTDIYDIARNAWVTGTFTGGTARGGATTAIYNGKLYGWGGRTTSAAINTLDILDLGVSKAQDVFYIANGAGTGADNGKLFRFDATGRAYTTDQGGWFSVGADYAEYMYTSDTTLMPGELVTLDDSNSGSIKRSETARDGSVIGVVSTNPGFVGNIKDINDLLNRNSNWRLLSMTGQVPVKVNNQNGSIKIGDSITSSSTPGEGMKADEGDPTIGIAEENYDAAEAGVIRVLITRNNSGINNKVELKLGARNEAGFRVNTNGRLEYRETSSDTWVPVSEAQTLDKSFSWQQVGDNIYSTNAGSTVLGIADSTDPTSKLEVNQTIEVRRAQNLIKLDASGNITIGGYAVDVGLRLNPDTKQLEFKDSINQEWKNLNSYLTATTRVEIDKVVNLPNQRQISGWGYIEGEANMQIKFPTKFGNIPIVNVSAAGASDTLPNSLAQCVQSTKFKAAAYQLSAADIYVQIKSIEQPTSMTQYYCYTWVASGL